MALRLATAQGESANSEGERKGREKALLQHLITIADTQHDGQSNLHEAFSTEDKHVAPVEKQELVLVDHNAPEIAGMSHEQMQQRFNVVGCVDHHVDESYVGKSVEPRIITTGIGSCTSLVVQHLKEEGLWLSPPLHDGDSKESKQESSSLRQMAKLALAPILIDTSKLRATGDKCSDTDRDIVNFLESHFDKDRDDVWNRDRFFDAISESKTNSLTLLTMQEIFDRDYKVWTETTKSGQQINIGTSSLVKPLSWLVEHAQGQQNFVDEIQKFAGDKDRQLGALVLLTRAGEGKKELAVLALTDEARSIIPLFERNTSELQLHNWEADHNLQKALTNAMGESSWRVWWQGDVSKSRKQVGPMIRQAVKDIR